MYLFFVAPGPRPHKFYCYSFKEYAGMTGMTFKITHKNIVIFKNTNNDKNKNNKKKIQLTYK